MEISCTLSISLRPEGNHSSGLYQLVCTISPLTEKKQWHQSVSPWSCHEAWNKKTARCSGTQTKQPEWQEANRSLLPVSQRQNYTVTPPLTVTDTLIGQGTLNITSNRELYPVSHISTTNTRVLLSKHWNNICTKNTRVPSKRPL